LELISTANCGLIRPSIGAFLIENGSLSIEFLNKWIHVKSRSREKF
jgi:2-methylaconitate cis-trans-isomerase PrpF